jgi:hypothetical protein
MADQNMNIVIGANVQQATQGLNTVSQGLAQTAIAANKLDSGLKSVDNEVSLSTRHALGFSQGLTELVASANNGSLSMGGFFEILRVGASEFKVIQQETGSTLQGFKGLFSTIFTEETVILLAVTAVAKLGEVFLEQSKKAKEAKDALEAHQKVLEGFEKTAADTTIKFIELTKVAADANAPLNERTAAIKDLHSQYQPFIKDLSDEQLLTGQLGDAYDKLNQSLIAKIAIQSAEDKIRPFIQQELDLQIKNAELQKVVNLGKQHTIDLTQAQTDKDKLYNFNLQKDSKDSQKAIDDNTTKLSSLRVQIANIFGDINGIISQGKEIDLIPSDKLNAAGETISKILADLNAQLTKDDLLEKALGVDESQQKISAIETAIERLLKIKVPADSTIIAQLLGDIQGLSLSKTLDDFKKFVQQNFKEAPINAPVNIKILPSVTNIDDFNTLVKRQILENSGKNFADAQGIKVPVNLLNDSEVLADFTKQMKEIGTVTQVVQQTFDSLFNSIANGQTVFKAIEQALTQLVVKLVSTVIEAAILSVVLNALFPGEGTGIGGTFSFLSELKSIGHFATGGIITTPTLALVGENGPERITPLSQISSNSSSNFTGAVEFKISGQTLRGILKRADNSASFIN